MLQFNFYVQLAPRNLPTYKLCHYDPIYNEIMTLTYDNRIFWLFFK